MSNCSSPFLKRQSLLLCQRLLAIFTWVCVGALCSVLLIYLSILLSIPQFLNYSSFMVTFKSSNVSSPTLFFSFNIVLAILDIFHLHMNYKISFPIFTNNLLGFFIGIVLNLQIILGRTDILVMLSYPWICDISSFAICLSFVVLLILILYIFLKMYSQYLFLFANVNCIVCLISNSTFIVV